MKAFAVFIFLCTQISIAWSLFKIAEHQYKNIFSVDKKDNHKSGGEVYFCSIVFFLSCFIYYEY